MTHVAPQVELGDRRPVGGVVETLLGNAAQRLAGADDVSQRGRWGVRGVHRRVWLPSLFRRHGCGTVQRGGRCPATEESATGAPTVDTARTPTAMRAARRSRMDAEPSVCGPPF